MHSCLQFPSVFRIRGLSNRRCSYAAQIEVLSASLRGLFRTSERKFPSGMADEVLTLSSSHCQPCSIWTQGQVKPRLVQISFSRKGGKTCYFRLGSVTRTNSQDRRFRLEPSMQHFLSVVAVLSSPGI